MATRDLVLSALLSAFIVALGLVPPVMLGVLPVPLHAQSLGVMLAGVLLGAKRGTVAVLLFLLLAALGLPVLSGGRGGLMVFMAPPTGYLLGFIPSAYLSGWIAERFVKKSQSALSQLGVFFLAAVAGGIVLDHMFGIVWLMLFAGLSLEAAFLGNLAFVPGDILKSAAAAIVARMVFNSYPLFQGRG
jgi:biotin transport system substrate-specific component